MRGEAINVACGDRITLLDMVALLNTLVGTEIPVQFVASRPGEVQHSQAGIERAESVLGYEPVVGFPEGLARTLAWYRARATDSAG